MKKYLFIPFTATFAMAVLSHQKANAQWSLSGNSNATTSSKLGTTNTIPLRLYTNNTVRLHINGNGGNVGIGTTGPVQRLDVNGNINLAKGFGLYMENHPVLKVDSVPGTVFLGNNTGKANTGTYNTATGYQSLTKNTYGSNNTANGAFALYHNTGGTNNVANGTFALFSNTDGLSNTAMGVHALYSNTGGSGNTAIGAGTLFENVGSNNTATGVSALTKNTTGNDNTAFGASALALTYNSTGNTAVGARAGYYYTNGWNNTFVGAHAATYGHALYNTIALGVETEVSASNKARIGNYYTSSIGGYVGWTTVSDGRVKRNLKENVPGLAFINKLKPVTYNLDLDAADKLSGRLARKDKDGNLIAGPLQGLDRTERQANHKILHTGFVAQEVEKAAKELGYEFNGVDAAKNEKDLYGLRYAEFVVPLVKAVQELNEKAEGLAKENHDLKIKLEWMEDRFKKWEAALTDKNNTSALLQMNSASETTASLLQNTPNPAKSSTRIAYRLPKGPARAQLLLADNSGKTLRTIPLTSSGAIDIDTSGWSSGVYTYSLVVNNRTIETRQLIVAR